MVAGDIGWTPVVTAKIFFFTADFSCPKYLNAPENDLLSAL